MGMTIDEYMAIKEQQACISKTIEILWNTAQQYKQLKADYENRLKADMLSMLYKLRSEIINMPKYFPYADHTRWFIDGDVVIGLIDNTIDTLKENEDALC